MTFWWIFFGLFLIWASWMCEESVIETDSDDWLYRD